MPQSPVTQEDPEDILDPARTKEKEIVLNNYGSGFNCHSHLNHISQRTVAHTKNRSVS